MFVSSTDRSFFTLPVPSYEKSLFCAVVLIIRGVEVRAEVWLPFCLI